MQPDENECTVWYGSPNRTCGQPATHRRGLRCPSGCWGEGVFDYACQLHAPALGGTETTWCISCDSALEWFEMQALERAT